MSKSHSQGSSSIGLKEENTVVSLLRDKASFTIILCRSSSQHSKIQSQHRLSEHLYRQFPISVASTYSTAAVYDGVYSFSCLSS